jgi:hypothetical protein
MSSKGYDFFLDKRLIFATLLTKKKTFGRSLYTTTWRGAFFV